MTLESRSGRPDALSLRAGQGVRLARGGPAAQLATLVREAELVRGVLSAR